MRAIAFLLAGLIAAGCAPKDRERRLAQVGAQGRNLDVTLDRLEERMLASQARVRLWREMRERHESVSAVACASQEEHALEMAMHSLQERSTLHQARVAAVAPATSKPHVRTTANR